MEAFVAKFFIWVSCYFRPIFKWLLHQTTRLTELQRICYGEPVGAPRSCGVETSLGLSRCHSIQKACKDLDNVANANDYDQTINIAIDNLVNTVIETKKIKKQLNVQFLRSLSNCSKQIWGYQRLKYDVEILRGTQFDESLHIEKLKELWSALIDVDVKPFVRKSKQWGEIGFQGDDPKTDFRGMGMLGLENLLYFGREFNKAAKHILSHSHHPKYGYSMAIVSINLTHMALKLLNDGSAKTHMYNVSKEKLNQQRPIELSHFHHFYAYLFIAFDQFWLDQKPENVMEFNRIRDLFENNMRTLLADKTVCLRINLVVDSV